MTNSPAQQTPATPTDSASRVLRNEGNALLSLADALPRDFDAAVRLILNNSGRVILSGMGKSGHIARKIAATMASTGTPSFYVHPAEASHGDLGMITPNDICVVISNSGETTELSDLLAYCLRFEIPVIGISKRVESTLMRAATLRLTLPDIEEACALGMAPTTSTTLTLGLGDALAIAIMEQREFRPENFRSFHPGGRLGAQLAKVSQLMHSGDSLPLVGLDAPMADAILRMSESSFGVTGVIDAQGLLVGVISDGDLRRNMLGLMDRTAGEVATRAPVTVAPNTAAAEAVALMNKRKIYTLFVVESDRIPVGVLRLHDCLRAGVV
ncbi:KpsF/GutQ family sugar-phosphate isomerase [Pararhodobacter sp.]|uniref:KpsF/GutQ family sugar-phosphate isomerase n=1 Tax=Pararhodobacter sp. TaxID=2127056 RepID=UPI002AFFF7D5|nr:KpsF/GutQ family sugar-phosphate isomerase [Pararhodobacter sp.]